MNRSPQKPVLPVWHADAVAAGMAGGRNPERVTPVPCQHRDHDLIRVGRPVFTFRPDGMCADHAPQEDPPDD